MHKDTFLLEGLKNGNEKTLSKVYLIYKSDFIAYAKKFDLSKDDIIDIYQDVILALRENVMSGKLTALNSSLKTYIFSIGKYMIYSKLRKKNNVHLQEFNEFTNTEINQDYDFLFAKELTENQKKLQIAFKELGKKCQQLLTLLFYNNYSFDDVLEELDYTSKDVVKSQKSRCLKTLKQKIK